MSDNSFVINRWRNKFKRLIIEVHYLKNRTSYQDNVIQVRDSNQPLFTLRTGTRCPHNHDGVIDEDKIEVDRTPQEDIDPLYFADFGQNDIQGTTEPNVRMMDEPYSQLYSGRRRRMGVSIKDFLHSMRSRNDSEEDLARLREQCNCYCHYDKASTLSDTHNSHCIRFCVHIDEEEDLAIVDRLMSNQVINYIEENNKPPARRKYWIFGPKIPLTVFERPSKQKEPPRIFSNIEIIAQSVSSPLEEEEEEGKTFHVVNQTEGVSAIELSSFSRKKFLRNSALVHSKLQGRDPMTCRCPTCDRNKRNQQTSREPWKVVLNDISLFAALVSTGSKPNFHSKSSINLAADFTSSKHVQENPSQKKFFNDEFQKTNQISNNEKELIVLDDDTNDENQDLLSSSANQNSQRTNVSSNNTRRKSLAGVPYKLESLAYDIVFQDYNYSDENPEEIADYKNGNLSDKINQIILENVPRGQEINKNEGCLPMVNSKKAQNLKTTGLFEQNGKQNDTTRRAVDKVFSAHADRKSHDELAPKTSKIQMLQKSFMGSTEYTQPLNVKANRTFQSKHNWEIRELERR